jgi:hypothetical protein
MMNDSDDDNDELDTTGRYEAAVNDFLNNL